MKRSWLVACVILQGSVALCSAAETSQYLQHPERDSTLAEIQGEIKEIQKTAHTLTVQDHSGQTVTVHVAKDARVLDSENHQLDWTSLKVGDKVFVYYDTLNHTTLQIDLRPTVGGLLLGDPDLSRRQSP